MLRLGSNRGAAHRALRPQLDALEARTLLATDAGYGQLPASFEWNAGQTDPQVRFLEHGPGYALFLAPAAAVLSLGQQAEADVLSMQLVGANAEAPLIGQDQQPGVTNYYLGNDPSQWHIGIPNFGRVDDQGIYPGIDLAYYSAQGQLEYDFDLAPGADPALIALRFQGAQSVALSGAGDLILHTTGGDVVEKAPVAHQEMGGHQVTVPARFVARKDGSFGFAVGRYERSQPLVIDPVLTYSTYLGGSSGDGARAVAVDRFGRAYVTGYTSSDNFPTKNPFQPTSGGSYDAFVAELSANGQSLVYSTYLGGSGIDAGTAIAVDAGGAAYVTGYTNSTNFPTKNALQPNLPGIEDAFVTKLAPGGGSLVYSTYLGGSERDSGGGIAVDAQGEACVAGGTDLNRLSHQERLPA
jgi:hypothetical protein